MGNASLRSPRGVSAVGALPYDTDYAQISHQPLTTLGTWPTATWAFHWNARPVQ
jgi:hypothetical protein